MPPPIILGAEFNSHAEYSIAFNQYCRENSIDGRPLNFVRQGSSKLHPNTFKNQILDKHTIDKFVYNSFTLVCAHNKSNPNRSNKNELFCESRMTVRFDRIKNVLRITKLVNQHQHSNPPIQTDDAQPETKSWRNEKIEQIGQLVNQFPDAALSLAEVALEQLLDKWSNSNYGVDIYIVPIENPTGNDNEKENVNDEMVDDADIKMEPTTEGKQKLSSTFVYLYWHRIRSNDVYKFTKFLYQQRPIQICRVQMNRIRYWLQMKTLKWKFKSRKRIRSTDLVQTFRPTIYNVMYFFLFFAVHLLYLRYFGSQN